MAVGETVTVKLPRETYRVLNAFRKKGGKLDEILLDWMEDNDPQAFIEELDRRRKSQSTVSCE